MPAVTGKRGWRPCRCEHIWAGMLRDKNTQGDHPPADNLSHSGQKTCTDVPGVHVPRNQGWSPEPGQNLWSTSVPQTPPRPTRSNPLLHPEFLLHRSPREHSLSSSLLAPLISLPEKFSFFLSFFFFSSPPLCPSPPPLCDSGEPRLVQEDREGEMCEPERGFVYRPASPSVITSSDGGNLLLSNTLL